MKLTAESFPIRFDPHLVEGVLLELAEVASSPERDRYRRERDAVYEVEGSDNREASFRELDARWFKRFGVADALVNVLREHASLASGISECYILPAGSHKDEGADLHAAKMEPTETGLPVLVIRLLPRTLADAQRLTLLLEHELLHVTDMLDPEFGYEPALPDMGKGPMFQRLIQERYRVLWNTTIDGRLARTGNLSPELSERRRREFLDGFKMLGEEADGHFERFFNGTRPTHGEIAAFAVRPGAEGSHGRQCPLCNLPTYQFQPSARDLHPRVLNAIRGDFPEWKDNEGLCLQCADLYESRIS